jgi:hypothetical protein
MIWRLFSRHVGFGEGGHSFLYGRQSGKYFDLSSMQQATGIKMIMQFRNITTWSILPANAPGTVNPCLRAAAASIKILQAGS